MKQLARHAATTAHLVLYGAIGPLVFATLVGLVSVGLGTLPLLGVGLLFIALAALLMYALGWLEERRVAGLLGVDIPDRPMRRSTHTDWLRGPMTLALQFADPRTWLALLHGGIISILGSIALGVVWLAGKALGYVLSPLAVPQVTVGEIFGIPLGDGVVLDQPWPVVAGLATLLVSALALLGLSIAHRAISLHMLVPNREAELEEAVEAVSVQRSQAMRAAEVERTRIERDLHDGVQPRLVSIGMQLGMAKAKLASDPELAARLIDEAHLSTKTAVTELRQLARGINPAVLKDRGLDAALSALVARSHIPVQLDASGIGRCPEEIESTMYFVVAEALTNAAKHSDAARCRVTIEQRAGGRLWARIEDDGAGGARRVPGGGIDGLANRVESVGGTFSLSSPEGGPTTIEASLPCAS